MGILTFYKIQDADYQTLVSLEFHEILEFDEPDFGVIGNIEMCFLKEEQYKYDHAH